MRKFFAIAAIFLAGCNSVTNGQSSRNIGVDEFEKRIAETKDAILLDVRTPEEFTERHIEHALNIDYNSSDFEKKVGELDKTKPVLIYCLSGGRSGKATRVLMEMGFKEVYNLEGGILKWTNSGKKVVSGGSASASVGMTLDNYLASVKKDKLVLVDFKAVWCGPCKIIKPMLDKLGKKHADKLEVMAIDVDQNKSLASEMHIDGIPLLIMYKDGKEVWRQLGLIEEKEMEAAILAHAK